MGGIVWGGGHANTTGKGWGERGKNPVRWRGFGPLAARPQREAMGAAARAPRAPHEDDTSGSAQPGHLFGPEHRALVSVRLARRAGDRRAAAASARLCRSRRAG